MERQSPDSSQTGQGFAAGVIRELRCQIQPQVALERLISALLEDADLGLAFEKVISRLGKPGDNRSMSSPARLLSYHPGRRVVEEHRQGENEWLRLEYVPCGKRGCRKDPDEHGPYWYRYDWNQARETWRARYIGREKPLIEPPDLGEIRSVLEPIFEREEATDVDVRMCNEQLELLQGLDGPDALELRRKASSLLARYSSRRERRTLERFEALDAKRARGEELSETERLEMKRVARRLFEEH